MWDNFGMTRQFCSGNKWSHPYPSSNNMWKCCVLMIYCGPIMIHSNYFQESTLYVKSYFKLTIFLLVMLMDCINENILYAASRKVLHGKTDSTQFLHPERDSNRGLWVNVNLNLTLTLLSLNRSATMAGLVQDLLAPWILHFRSVLQRSQQHTDNL